MLKLIDANNYLRRALEGDPTGLAPRSLFMEAFNSKENQIWVWDAPDGNARRREIYPEYKRNRTPPKDDIRQTMDLVKEVMGYTRALQITVPGYEADDVIATIAKSEGGHIVSNDSDYTQLLQYPNVTTTARPIEGVAPEYVRLYKTLVGDTADNIPGLRGFGPKKFESLFHRAWNDYFSGGPYVPELLDDHPYDEMIFKNDDVLRAFWQITGFFDVPVPLIQQYLQPGVPDFARGDARLKEFLN